MEEITELTETKFIVGVWKKRVREHMSQIE